MTGTYATSVLPRHPAESQRPATTPSVVELRAELEVTRKVFANTVPAALANAIASLEILSTLMDSADTAIPTPAREASVEEQLGVHRDAFNRANVRRALGALRAVELD